MPRIEPGAAGWEAWTLPLCYAAPLLTDTLFVLLISDENVIKVWGQDVNMAFDLIKPDETAQIMSECSSLATEPRVDESWCKS